MMIVRANKITDLSEEEEEAPVDFMDGKELRNNTNNDGHCKTSETSKPPRVDCVNDATYYALFFCHVVYCNKNQSQNVWLAFIWTLVFCRLTCSSLIDLLRPLITLLLAYNSFALTTVLL